MKGLLFLTLLLAVAFAPAYGQGSGIITGADSPLSVDAPIICGNLTSFNAGLCVSHDNEGGVGGLRSAMHIAGRDAIPTRFRSTSLVVHVADDGTGVPRAYTFASNAARTNGDWIEVPLFAALARTADLAALLNAPSFASSSAILPAALTHVGKVVELSREGDQLYQIPTDATLDFDDGAILSVQKTGTTGTVSFAPADGGTTTIFGSCTLSTVNYVAQIRKSAANVWRFLSCGAPSGGASAWGDLTGTLSDQTDFQAALDRRPPPSSAARSRPDRSASTPPTSA